MWFWETRPVPGCWLHCCHSETLTLCKLLHLLELGEMDIYGGPTTCYRQQMLIVQVPCLTREVHCVA